MKALIIACFAVLAVGCQSVRCTKQPIVYAGGDGSSSEQAVVIREAGFREAGILAERVWLDQKYPGRREAKQSALESASRHYDVVEFATAEGEPRKVFFDATEFVNK